MENMKKEKRFGEGAKVKKGRNTLKGKSQLGKGGKRRGPSCLREL